MDAILTANDSASAESGSGLVRSRAAITAARSRTGQRSDGGSTGRSDGND
jgi:hypothetical protein